MSQYFKNDETWGGVDLRLIEKLAKGSQVFGIGEGAHFVHEFSLARIFLAKFLIESCGFTHIALEIGQIQAAKLTPWAQGEGSEEDLSLKAGALTCGIYGDLLRWLRAFNEAREHPVILIGPDLPNDMNLLSEVEKVIAYLRIVDPDAILALEAARQVCAKISSGSAAVAVPAWNQLDIGEQLLLSASLARISRRMEALEAHYVAKSDSQRFQQAFQHMKTACDLGYMLRAMSELFSGVGLAADTSVRERYAGTSMLSVLSANPNARILFIAHNNHIQKEPLYFGEQLLAFTTGFYLSRSLGDGYRAVGLTHAGSSVPEMDFPAPNSPVGFNVATKDLSDPPTGSVERFILESGLSTEYALVDLTTDNAEIAGLNCVRSQADFVNAPLARAFDAILTAPAATMIGDLPY